MRKTQDKLKAGGRPVTACNESHAATCYTMMKQVAACDWVCRRRGSVITVRMSVNQFVRPSRVTSARKWASPETVAVVFCAKIM